MKTININKRDLVEIISWSFIKGITSERFKKRKSINSVNRTDYKEAKKFIMDAYWYQRENDNIVSLVPVKR